MNLSGAHRWEVAEFVAVHKPAHTYREIAALVAAQWNGGTDVPTKNQMIAAYRDLPKLRAAHKDSAPVVTPIKSEPQRTVDTLPLSPPMPPDTIVPSVQNGLMLPGDLTFDDLVKIADVLRGALDHSDPVVDHQEMTLGDGGPVGIVFASCPHLGGRYTNHKAIRDMLDRALLIPNLYWAPLGDDIEGYLAGFADASSVHEQAMNVDLQLLMLRAMLIKIAGAGRLLFGTASQHGGKWWEKRGSNPIKDAYRGVGVPWFDGQAYLKLHVGSQVYQVAVAHEFPGHSMYNQLHPHARALRWDYPMADVIVQGDKHTYAVSEVTSYIREFDAGNRASPFTWFVQTGTAKTGLDKYTVKRWPHGIMEWPILIFEEDDHNIECTRHWRTVSAWLDQSDTRKVA